MIILFSSVTYESLALLLFYTTTFVAAPLMLLTNLYGNLLYEMIDNQNDCKADPFAKTYMLIFLIVQYCVLFIYLVFACSVREQMKRYFVQVYLLNDDQVQDYIENTDEEELEYSTPVIKGRTWSQQKTAFAYTMWVMAGTEDGPSTRDELDFIMEQRNTLKMQLMHSTMKDLKFDMQADLETCSNSSSNYSLDDSSLAQGLLLNQSSSDAAVFKYGCCTICLSDFEQGDSVKQVPGCKHTFHKQCLEKWLVRKFSCPNCNLEIADPSACQS